MLNHLGTQAADFFSRVHLLAFLLMLADDRDPSDLGAADGALSNEQSLAIIADYLRRKRSLKDGSQ